jgi:hypothetical protein
VTTVTVLASRRVDLRKIGRKLTGAGYAVAATATGLTVAPHDSDTAVHLTGSSLADLSEEVLHRTARLLGVPPAAAVTFSFDGAGSRSPAWPTVVSVARTVAAQVPLAVLDDHHGTTYLVHPARGLIGPEEYRYQRGGDRVADLLRRLLGNDP